MTNQPKLWSGWKVWGVALAFIFLASVIGEPVQGKISRKNQRVSRSITHSLRLGSYQNPPTTTTWKNQRGSTMVLTNDGKGNLTGTYKTAVGCKPGVPRKLFGTINGSAITFIVNWEDCGSVTAWTGHFDDRTNPKQIQTLWLLSIGTGGTAPSDFKTTLAGSDDFMKVP
jgi:hypothetical protein